MMLMIILNHVWKKGEKINFQMFGFLLFLDSFQVSLKQERKQYPVNGVLKLQTFTSS